MRVHAGHLLGVLLALFVAAATTAAQTPALGPGTHQQTFTHGGRTRTYLLRIPPRYDGRTPVPLVLLFHGGGGTAAQIERYVGFNALADRGGFIGVVPDGISMQWNDGRSDSARLVPLVGAVDDVGFIAALLDQLTERFRIDQQRIYAMGFSNGGFLSNRLGMELSSRFAAIAPVAGSLGQAIAPNLAPQSPVAVLYIHGTRDQNVPYEGGEVVGRSGVAISAARLVDLWVKANGCVTSVRTEQLPDRDPNDGTRVRRDVYGPCRAGTEVLFYTIEGGGHNWPGKPVAVEFGPATKDIDATELIWEFFQRNAKGR